MSKFLPALVLTLFVAAACGSDDGVFPSDAVAIRASADVATGPERLLVAVATADGSRLGGPEVAVTLRAAPLDAPDATQEVPGVWTWLVPEATGLYRGNFSFETPGVWEVTVIPDDGAPLEPVAFTVVPDSCRSPDAAQQGLAPCAPRIGEQAPAAQSPTVATTPLADLTTDPTPDPRLYELSLDEALGNGRQTVVVFATPAFCTTAACGPLLDAVKGQIDAFPEVDFVHVEVFTGFNEPGFQPDAAHLAPAVVTYQLVTEPWAFVTDETGVIVGRFEGVMDPTELTGLLG